MVVAVPSFFHFMMVQISDVFSFLSTHKRVTKKSQKVTEYITRVRADINVDL